MAASEKGRIDRGEDESSDQLHYEANSDRPLAYIVNFLPDPTFVIDKEELLNHHPSQTAPERQPDGSLSFEKAEEMMRMAFEKGTHRFEWVRRRKNGEEFPVEATLTAIPWGDRQILHLIIKDITERKRAKDALSEGGGAGLAIVKKIIEVHRGRTWIESELGKDAPYALQFHTSKMC